MKNGIKAALIITFAIGGIGGSIVQERLMRPEIVKYRAGHYDMLSGDFMWGPPPRTVEVSSATMDMQDQLTEYSQNAAKPVRTK